MYNSTMMGFTINGSCNAMDISYDNKNLIVCSKEGVKILRINRNADYWFEPKTTLSKNRFQSHYSVINIACNQNSLGKEKYAIGTFNKFLYIYNIDNPKYSQCMQCFQGINSLNQDNYIGVLQWETNSADVIYATSNGNTYIAKWDLRTNPSQIQIQHMNKQALTSDIVDFACNPLNENYYAVLFDDNSFSVFDKRKSFKKELYKLSDQDKDNDAIISPGNNFIKLEWDPKNQDRIAVADENAIRIWKINEGGGEIVNKFQQKQIKIKDFYWRKNTESEFFFTLSSKLSIGEIKQGQEILQFDFSLPESKQFHSYFASDFYDYQLGEWMLDRSEQLLITCSKAECKEVIKKFGKESHIILVQELNNKILLQERDYKPIAFDNDNGFATVVSFTDKKKKVKTVFPRYLEEREKSAIKINKKELQKIEEKMKKIQKSFQPTTKFYLSNYKEQIKFLHKYYLRGGTNAAIIQRNKAIAKCLSSQSKNLICAPFWDMLFSLAFPKESLHTLQSLFEDKIQVELAFEDNRVFIDDKDKLNRKPPPFNIEQKIQYLVDQNQLQTAIIAALIIRNQNPKLINQQFIEKLLNPFIQILERYELYEIVAETILFSKLQNFIKVYKQNTSLKIKCGRCSQSYGGKCFCNEKCILCSKPLKTGYLMWCKICGHAGHAKEYEEWFKKNRSCPYGCTHECFAFDFQQQ